MRDRKSYIVITFHTTTDAMAFEAFCMKHQIPGRLIPVPREISAGCGLAWRSLPEELSLRSAEVENCGISYDRQTEMML